MAGLTEMTGKKVVDKIDGVYYSEMVKRIIGYMVTWTTYGTWLQGEKKGYVKNGKILAQNDKLKSANQRQQKYPTVKLNSELRKFGSQGKIWSTGFDKRFCFTDKEIENKVR
jgi:hypothetical protein